MAQWSKRLRRALRESRAVRRGGAVIVSGYLRLCRRTTLWRRDGWENAAELVASGRPFVLTVWHGRLAMIPAFRHELSTPVSALISSNHDGDLIAAVLARFGVDAVRGSSYNRRRGRPKGGAQALRKIIDALEAGSVAAVTPDGPRGPRMRAESGAARAAITAGVPVLCVGVSTRGGWMINSWDRFLLPRPFTRGAAAFAPVIDPGQDDGRDGVEALRRKIEDALTACQRRADALTGRISPEPGPESRRVSRREPFSDPIAAAPKDPLP